MAGMKLEACEECTVSMHGPKYSQNKIINIVQGAVS